MRSRNEMRRFNLVTVFISSQLRISDDYFFAPYLKYVGKIFLSNARFVTFFNRCLPIPFTLKRCLFTFLSVKCFSLNCGKFAVECDCSSNNFQNVQNLGFFDKNSEIFQNRYYMWQIFSRMRLKWHFFLKMSFPFFLRFFWRKSEKIKVGKVRKYDEQTEYFGKNAFMLLIDIFSNVGGRKISRR